LRALSLSLAAVLVVSTVANSAFADPAESEIEAPGPKGPLKGLMLTPGKPDAPVVLIIAGSGPIDRNGNSLHGLNADTYKLLAEGLAARDVASVRIDKRGLYSSAAAIANADAATIGDYASDVHTWIATIRKQTGAKCVWMLGHDEGALVAMVAAKDNPPDICGLLLVAAPGRRFSELIKDQMRSNPSNAPFQDEAFHDIDELAAGRRVDVAKARSEIQSIFAPAVQGFLVDLFSYDPALLLAQYKGPVLILQGERDIQVGQEDAKRLAAADPGAKLVLLPDVNHILKTVDTDDRMANLGTYLNAALPLAPGVVETLADFVAAARKSP